MSATITKIEKIKIKSLMAQGFMPALSNLSSQDLPMKSSYWIGKSINKINSHIKDYDAARTKSLKKYAELDENGEIITTEGDQVKFKSDDTKAAFTKELEELQDQEVDVIKVSSEAILVAEAKIKPWVFSALDEIIY